MLKKILFGLFTSLLIYGTIHVLSARTSSANAEETSEILQDAVLTDIEGNEYTLADFEGYVLMLDFWETWCTPCLNSKPAHQTLMEEFEETFLVLAITPGFRDTPENVQSFIDNSDYNFVYLFGEQLSLDLNINNIPHKVFIGPDGQYIRTIVGSRGPEGDYMVAKNIIESSL